MVKSGEALIYFKEGKRADGLNFWNLCLRKTAFEFFFLIFLKLIEVQKKLFSLLFWLSILMYCNNKIFSSFFQNWKLGNWEVNRQTIIIETNDGVFLHCLGLPTTSQDFKDRKWWKKKPEIIKRLFLQNKHNIWTVLSFKLSELSLFNLN